MNKGIKIGAVIIILIPIVGLLVTRSKSSSHDTYKIGGAFALTGDVAVYGEADRDGAQLAVNEINANGGIKV